jgi:ubiquitin C-terminal hydrolase
MEDQNSSAKELFGFENLGLTCYAGAALQCIQAIKYYLTGSLLINDQMGKQELKNYYTNTLTFENIFTQNDSSEALLQLLEKCLCGHFI